MDPVPCNTTQAALAISRELNLTPQVVRLVLDRFVEKIRNAFRNEMPFAILGLGKFYFKYAKRKVINSSFSDEYYKDKVNREVAFSPTNDVRSEFMNWIPDLGVKDNQFPSIAKLKVTPIEFSRMIKNKTLQEQRSLGFRSELLFDELPEAEKAVVEDMKEYPTVEQIMRRIGFTLGD